MIQSEITMRTKKVVRNWAKIPNNMALVVDDKLSSLRQNALDELLQAINEEFVGENNFPISQSDWGKADTTTVRDVRDLVDSRINKEV